MNSAHCKLVVVESSLFFPFRDFPFETGSTVDFHLFLVTKIHQAKQGAGSRGPGQGRAGQAGRAGSSLTYSLHV